jgi:hypothetical protein
MDYNYELKNMIRVIYNLTTKQISTVVWASGETLYNQATNGMIQGDIDTVLTMVLSIGIPVDDIIIFLTTEGIDTTGITDRVKVLKNQRFGMELLLEFFTGTTNTTLPNEIYRTITDVFYYAETALRRGDIPQAKIELQNIPNMEPIWTSAVQEYFINKIDNYLAS